MILAAQLYIQQYFSFRTRDLKRAVQLLQQACHEAKVYLLFYRLLLLQIRSTEVYRRDENISSVPDLLTFILFQPSKAAGLSSMSSASPLKFEFCLCLPNN
jgi:hypothetical protein